MDKQIQELIDKNSKEMVYQSGRIREVLFRGQYEGYKFAIVNLGTHPVAYVECKIQVLSSCKRCGDISETDGAYRRWVLLRQRYTHNLH